jgi:cytochrome c peroxidase
MYKALLGIVPFLALNAAEFDKSKLAEFQPLPAVIESKTNPITPEKIALGRMLYYEKRLSRNQDVACNTCHLLNSFGVDGERFSTGFKGQKGGRNAPTVYNAAGHIAQFWDGRAPDVEEQAKGPVMNPVEMAMPSQERVVTVLKSMPDYVRAFQKAFPREPDPVTFDNMAKSIGAFERKLVTPSRWDRFLRGNDAALTAEEKAGLARFTEAGCQSCHSGPFVGGRMYQKLGLAKSYPDKSDAGRYVVTKEPGDQMMFKVPSLRNVEKTGPYFHNGSAPSLEQAVRNMGEYQLNKKLSDEDTRLMVAWLKTLTGEPPKDYIKPPKLPKSSDRTPKPEKS